MLNWSLACLLIALLAALLGFGDVAGKSAAVAQLLFVLFLGGSLLLLAFIRRSVSDPGQKRQ